MNNLVIVDGPNLVNDVGRYLTKSAPSTASAELQRSYYESWFDIDRLVRVTLTNQFPIGVSDDLGIVIVHSRKGIGERDSAYSIQGDPGVSSFWGRQGANDGTSTLQVDVPGGGNAEKGIDTSIVVYLFETLDSWDAAVLFSNDSDFVPPVWSLRRKGKRLFCAAHLFDNQAGPLVAACQHFFPLDVRFLEADRAVFEAFAVGGPIDQFLAADANAWTRFSGNLEIHGSEGRGPVEMNEILRASGHHEYVHAVGGAGTFTVGLRPMHDDPSGLRAMWITSGLSRHFGQLNTSMWQQRVKAR